MDMQEREQEQGRHTGCKTFHHKRPPFLRNEVFLAIVLPVLVMSWVVLRARPGDATQQLLQDYIPVMTQASTGQTDLLRAKAAY